MSNMVTALDVTTLAVTLGRAILASNLKALLVLAAALSAAALLRRRSATVRHRLWVASLGCLILAFVVVLWLPPLAIRVLPPESVRTPRLAVTAPTARSMDAQPGSSSPIGMTVPVTIDDTVESGGASSSTAYLALVALWGLGLLVHGIRFGSENSHMRRLLRRSDPLPDRLSPVLTEVLARFDGQDARRPRVRVRISSELQIPIVWGAWRPALLLPEASLRWPYDRLRIVLSHELAHLTRRDTLTTLVAYLALALYWPNPLVWLAGRRLVVERERACDERVLASGIEPTAYADHLIAVARSLTRPPASGLALASTTVLEQRIQSILRYGGRYGGTTRLGSRLTLLAVLVIGTALGMVRVMERRDGMGDSEEAQGPTRRGDTVGRQERLRAIWTMGEREDAEAVAEVIRMLSHEDPGIRELAAWTLGEIKDPVAVVALEERSRDPDPFVREMAVRALGELERPSAIPALEHALADEASNVRAAAVWSLGEIATPAALTLAEAGLEDPDPRVREEAVKVVGSRLESAPFASLVRASRDSDPRVREAAVARLGETRRANAITPLLTALDDDSPSVRRRAARALGVLGHPGAVEGLIRHLRTHDPELRSLIVWALDEIGPAPHDMDPRQSFDRERLPGIIEW